MDYFIISRGKEKKTPQIHFEWNIHYFNRTNIILDTDFLREEIIRGLRFEAIAEIQRQEDEEFFRAIDMIALENLE